MIGLLGAQIWVRNRVDLSNPINLVPVAAGIIVGIGGVTLHISKNFELGGIALGTIVVLVGYHGLRALAPAYMRAGADAPLADAVAGPAADPAAGPAAPERSAEE